MNLMSKAIWWTAGILVSGALSAAAAPEAKEATKAEANAAEWVSLVPEEGMGKWKGLNFGGEGLTTWKDGVLTIEEGAELTGVVWSGAVPEAPYQLELEARRTSGVDFFCGLTFPVRDKETCVTLIVGGWGGGVVGISSIDGMDASENETAGFRAFKDDQWYKVRLEVRKNSLQAWIDGVEVVNVDTTNRKLGLRFGDIDKCVPLGLATWQTTAELKNLRWRPLKK